MTIEEEEDFIIDKLQDARHRLDVFKKDMSARKFKQNEMEAEVEKLEQALVDYMTGNGLVQTGRVSLRKYISVEVPDIEAVPERFQRIKTVIEPNKILIRELEPAGNWYQLKENYKIMIGEK